MASTIVCRKCGTENAPDSQYCDQCSAPLQGQAPPPVVSRPVPFSPASLPLEHLTTAPPADPAAEAEAEARPAGTLPTQPIARAAPAPPAVSRVAPGEQIAAPKLDDGPATPGTPGTVTPVPVPTGPVTTVRLPAADLLPTPDVQVKPVTSTLAVPPRKGLPAAVPIVGALVVGLLGIAIGAFLAGNNSSGSATPTVTVVAAATGQPGLPTSVAAGGATAVPTRPTATPAPPTLAPNSPAAQLLAAGQYGDALAAFEAALKTNPQDGAALLGKGQALTGLERYDDAVNTLTEALAARGVEDPPTLLARAQANTARRSWGQVIQDADVLLKADPTNRIALALRANAHAQQGDGEAALADYTAAIAADPQNADLYIKRGNFYLANNRKADALTDFDRATNLAPQNPQAWLALGRGRRQYDEKIPGDGDSALLAFDRAVGVAPDLAEAYYERGRTYHDFKGDEARALADLNKAISLGPVNADMYYIHSRIERSLGNGAAQVADLDRAVALDPKQEGPYWWLLDYHAEHDEWDAAVDDMTKIITLNGDREAYLVRSPLYLYLGKHGEALADANHVITQQPDQWGGYFARARILFSDGDWQAALDDLNKALEKVGDYDRPQVQAARGRTYVKLKNLDAAATDLKAALDAQSSNERALLGQAELILARGQTTEARAALDKCVENNNGDGMCYVLRAQMQLAAGDKAAAQSDLDAARGRILFPDEKRAADDVAKKLGP
jgi:tetratricopeptide (TPR) repeat protein